MRLFFFMLLLWVSPLTFAQNGNSTLFCQQLEKLNRIIANEHYSPKPLDDSLSVGVYQLFLEKLNDEHWFFLKEDMDLFEKDRLQLDDYLKEKNCLFIDKYVDRYSQRINQIAAFLDTLKTQELDYSGIDTLSFVDRPNERYFSNLATLKKSWKKKARFAILSKIIEEDSVYGEIEQNFTQLEAQLKEKVIQDLICQLEELLNQEGGIEEFVKKSFLNSIANYQDPNTNFFSASDKDYFDNSLSSSQFSFGIYTTKNKQGEIEVSYIAPGSIASKDGTIEESDIIKSLFSVSSQTNMDTFCVSNNEIAYFLNDSKNNTVRFRIKKKDGTIKEIQLTKELIKSPENLTRAYLIKNTEDVGYINIPSFYTDMESPNGLGVANDVAKEIYKLEKQNIKGLIIDLRFNGGGSIKEVADLTGMFINRGPISIFKGRNNETFTYRDSNKGALFTKPIVIIVNSFSASASEFYAAAMQDYGRAIIVGSPTYGKSSSQVILPLSEIVNMGYCKITTHRFYRITGKSSQSSGVIPDIVFPSLYDGLGLTEQYLDFVLPNDSTAVEIPFKPLKLENLDQIITNSTNRIVQSESFGKIKKANADVRSRYFDADRFYPITLENVYKDVNGYNTIWSQFNDFFNTKKTAITAENTPEVAALIKYNEEELELNKETLKSISEDIYIEEAYRILLDYFDLNH